MHASWTLLHLFLSIMQWVLSSLGNKNIGKYWGSEKAEKHAQGLKLDRREAKASMWLAAPTSPCGGLLATYRKYLRTCICKEVCPAMFTAALLTVAKTWRRLACAVTEAWKQARCTRTMQHSTAIRWSAAPCDNADGSWEHHAKWSKSEDSRTLRFHSNVGYEAESNKWTNSQTWTVWWLREGRGLWMSKE